MSPNLASDEQLPTSFQTQSVAPSQPGQPPGPHGCWPSPESESCRGERAMGLGGASPAPGREAQAPGRGSEWRARARTPPWCTALQRRPGPQREHQAPAHVQRGWALNTRVLARGRLRVTSLPRQMQL